MSKTKTGGSGGSARKLVSANRPLLIGHRGYSAVAPENTLPSFQRALGAGSDLVELDYRYSLDGVAVAIHDDTLDRTTDAVGKWRRSRVRVAATAAADIRTLDAGRWFGPEFSGTRVPLLAEALGLIAAGGGTAAVEHKAGDAASCVALLRDGDWMDRVVVISFDWVFLRRLHELAPGVVLGALGPTRRGTPDRAPLPFSGTLSRKWLDALRPTGASIAVWNRRVTAASIEQAHQRGLRVWVYTVNDTRLAKSLLGRGVDGIITNRIVTIQKAFAESAHPVPITPARPGLRLRH